ncbi:methionyl-tRNA formyltransferase [Alcaligenaceae bacterium]|nr:methionyl-tRNA formyltransferase [Alcaligenaceae bacterium]
MKVLLITQGLSRLVRPLFDSEYEVVGVAESMPRDFNNKKKQNALFSIASSIYKNIKGTTISLKSFCDERKIPYNFICKGRDQEIADWVKELAPDLIVIFSMSQLIKESLLSIPKLGVINLHPSYLPDYRGANPDFWQYHNMEMNPGVTVHYIDKGEDTGDIIFQERIVIPLGIKSPERLDKLIGEVGVPLVFKALQAIRAGNVQRVQQPKESPTERARNIQLEEHTKIVDWQNWPIERIWHILRGTELWLNAIPQPNGIYHGQRWVVEEFEKQQNIHKPGKLTKYKGRHVVAMPSGYIYLTRRFSFKNLVISILKN